MFFRLGLIGAAALGLGACTDNDGNGGYGNYGGGIGYAGDIGYGGGGYYGGGPYDRYYGNPYGYRRVPYGFAGAGYGWNGGYCYPGTGNYRFDRQGRRSTIPPQQRAFWNERARDRREFAGERRRDDRGFRAERRADRRGLANGVVTRPEDRTDRQGDRQAYRQDRRGDVRDFRQDRRQDRRDYGRIRDGAPRSGAERGGSGTIARSQARQQRSAVRAERRAARSRPGG